MEKLAKPMLSDSQWKGQACAVLGGGPSLRNCDLRGLRNLRTICCNFAYELWPDADCIISEDVRFFQLAAKKESWKAFKGEKILSCLEPSYEPLARAAVPDIRIIPRKRQDKFWAKSIDEGLSYSSNSMVPALNLADILGADPIYILGLDCQPVKRGEPTNFHDHYRKAGFETTGNHQLESFKSDFTYWVAPNLRHRKVLNLNVDSGIQCWPRVSPESVFGEEEWSRSRSSGTTRQPTS